MGQKTEIHGSEHLPDAVWDQQTPGVTSLLRAKLDDLLRAQRYEDALDVLQAAHQRAPDSHEIAQGMRVLEDRLISQYLERMGSLDAVPCLAIGVDRHDVPLEQTQEQKADGTPDGEPADGPRSLLDLVDGHSSFSDIANRSTLGRFEAYRALDRLLREGVVATTGVPPQRTALAAHAPPLAAEPPVVAPPPERSFRLVLVCLFVVAIAGSAWMVLGRYARPLQRASYTEGDTTMGETSGGGRRAPAIVQPIDLPPSRRAQNRWQGKPSAKTSTPTSLPLPRPEHASLPATPTARQPPGAAPRPAKLSRAPANARGAIAERQGGSAQGGAPAMAPGAAIVEVAPPVPAPASEAASVSTGDGAVGQSHEAPPRERVAPSLPDEPVPRRSASGAPSLPDEPPPRKSAFGAPSLPDEPPRRRRTAGPGDVSVAATDVAVRGSLSRAVVEQAIARAQAGFHACYAPAALAANRDAGGTVAVQLSIDETGQAGAVSAQTGPLPGLAACVQRAAALIRTREPPDIGIATVTFQVAFTVRGP
jgi:hypothetical protein